ncbi:hypothetical protein D3C78_1968840 [compost metagenome]
MSTSLTRMPWNTFDAENTQMAGKVWLPQKCPPARTIEIFWRFVGGEAPNPFIGYPKSSELMVIPE